MPILPPLSRPQLRRIHKIIHATRDKEHACSGLIIPDTILGGTVATMT